MKDNVIINLVGLRGGFIGSSRLSICFTRDDLERAFPTALSKYPIECYLTSLNLPLDYPIVFLHEISVIRKRRNKGHGTELIKRVELFAKEKGCHMIVLKVGWSAGGWRWRRERDKNIHFYKRNSFILYSPDECSSLLAFKSLDPLAIAYVSG